MAGTAEPWRALKDQGNQAFGQGHYSWAIVIYEASEAVARDAESPGAQAHLAVAASNIAAAQLKLHNHAAAEAAAQRGQGLLSAVPGSDAKLSERLQGRVGDARSMQQDLSADDGDAEERNAAGAERFKRGEALAAKWEYLCVAAKEELPDGLRARVHANLALVSLRLDEADRAQEHSLQALRLLEGIAGIVSAGDSSVDVEKLRGKVRARQSSAGVLGEVLRNYGESLLASTPRPSRLEGRLRSAVLEGSRLFCVNEFLVARWALGQQRGRRFLATIGALTCIAFFAWGRGVDGQCVGLGCHVPVGCILHGALMQKLGSGRHVLQELVDALKAAFKDLDPLSLRAHLVGGHRYTDIDAALKMYYPNDPPRQSLSWHVLDAARAGGLRYVNTALANKFQGGDCSSMEQELRLRMENQRFLVAALDLESGYVVTHTEEASSPVPPSWWARERPPAMGGQPLQDAALLGA